MNLLLLIRIAFDQLRANRMRSILTTLGIIIGVGTVILIVSVLEGYRSSIEQELNILGSNTFQVQKWGPRINVGSHSHRKMRPDLTVEMADAIREQAKTVKYVGAELWQFGETVVYEGERTNPNIMLGGATPEFAINNGYFIGEGRFITTQDVRSNARVVVLGMDIVDKLFPYSEPLGKQVRIKGKRFKVIGIFEAQGNSTFGESRDNRVAIPISTWQELYGRDRSVNITVMAKSPELFQQAQDEVIGILRKQRKLKPGAENDFDIFFNQTLVDSFNKVARYIQIGGILIGLVSLAVGGIGVMNIMLVSVRERTREIGIRKAVGAQRHTILTQFLMEAIALCILGGILGFLIGVGLAGLVAALAGLPVSIPLWAVVSALLTTTAIGLFAGIYPAYRAANLYVVDALRYE
ncbi:MAG: ABC transporter permease [Calditrichia bacterium]